MIVTRLLFPPNTGQDPVPVSLDIASIYDNRTESFRLNNQTNATFILRPTRSCRESDKFVLMVLSVSGDVAERNRYRDTTRMKTADVVTIFLLGASKSSAIQVRITYSVCPDYWVCLGSLIQFLDMYVPLSVLVVGPWKKKECQKCY